MRRRGGISPHPSRRSLRDLLRMRGSHARIIRRQGRDRVSTAFTRSEIEAGRKLFTGEWQFAFAAGSLDRLPPMRNIEVAFAGRSNVGKSSLINALTGRKALARTS